MLVQIIVAVAIAVLVALACILAGRVIKSMGGQVPVLAEVGSFLEQFAWVIGLLFGILAFVQHWNPFH